MNSSHASCRKHSLPANRPTNPLAGENPAVITISSAARRWLAGATACAAFSVALPSTAWGEQVVAKFELGIATLEEVQQAMDSGALSSVQLVNLYLRRIELYDQGGAPFFNSIMFLSPDLMEDARKADKLRAEGKKLGPLHGIPCLVKGSYSIKGN